MTDRTEVNLGGSDFGDRLSEAGFSIVTGWDDELAEQLRIASEETTIQFMTPRDHNERFVDIDAAHNWFESRKKIVYSLLGSTADLAGFIWFSSEEYQGADKTFAVRLYRQSRGRGLAAPFANLAHNHLEETLGYSGDVWLETGEGNLTARHLFSRLGYADHPDPRTDAGRVKMIRPGIATMLSELGDV